MSLSEKNKRAESLIKPNVDKPIDSLPDRRAKMIYERYQSGRPIIMDDLKYLYKKDPEGCDTLVKHIIDPMHQKDQDLIASDKELSLYQSSSLSITNQQTEIEYKGITVKPNRNIDNIMEALYLVKMMLKQGDNDQLELLNIHNESTKLATLIQKMNHWDDMFSEQLVRYTYEAEKEFNILA